MTSQDPTESHAIDLDDLQIPPSQSELVLTEEDRQLLVSGKWLTASHISGCPALNENLLSLTKWTEGHKCLEREV